MLSVTLAVLGAIYATFLFRIGPLDGVLDRGFMAPFALMTGMVASNFLLLYFIEVMRSGWLTLKRGILLLSPSVVSVIIFFVILRLAGLPLRKLDGMTEFINSFNEFDVWYRLVFLIIATCNVGGMGMLFVRLEPHYRKWTDENYSSTELMDISWLRYLLLVLILLALTYYFMMFNPTITPVYLHFIMILVFFPYIIYKGLFQKNPYPENFFRKAIPEEDFVTVEKENNTENGFDLKMEEYRKLFEQWMENEKPYLLPDFKLADLQQHYPMNRTYLARFFSDTYGCSFRILIRRYRVNEAVRILQESPNLITKELFSRCGFTSEVVFHRSFTEETGMTPKQFRTKYING